VRIRGTIDEVGAQRTESVSMAAQNAMGSAAVGALTAIPRAIGVILALLFAPLRLLLLPRIMGGGRKQSGPDQLQVPVTPFVLRADDGNEYDCMIRGEVRGGFLKLGEAVEVSGRIDRSRVVRVDQVQSIRTNAITKGWIDPRARMAQFQAVAGVVFLVFLLIFLISIISAFERH
jgi:ABC-type antimicrobial peptide transport system permease subunit